MRDTVYCVLSDEGALVNIYQNYDDAEADRAGRGYGWSVVARIVW